MDGSEIHEATLTLLWLAKTDAEYQCLAPDTFQFDVIDHISGNPIDEKRHVIRESARIARGSVLPLSKARAEDYDGVILPGGFGAAKNLSDFALKARDCQVHGALKRFLLAMHNQGKPIGAICIAPVVIAKVFEGVVTLKLTIGTDANTADNIEAMGHQHTDCAADDIVVDEANRVLSTPAYMLGKTIKDVEAGIAKLVKRIVAMA